MNEQVKIVDVQVNKVAALLRSSEFPIRHEPYIANLTKTQSINNMANAYLAIVAICHQTSPIGERQLEGYVAKLHRKGWDYLKEKFFLEVSSDSRWSDPMFWRNLTPIMLSELYKDDNKGYTLSRINERTYLLNDLGDGLIRDGNSCIGDAIENLDYKVGGDKGFLKYLSRFEAYSDPLYKKSYFFLSLAETECGWQYKDPENILSPVDYHELRGHIRLGTVVVTDERINHKLVSGLPISIEEDLLIRKAVQQTNKQISNLVGVSDSELHYLFWYIFRCCCSRKTEQTHCSTCSPDCNLPETYKMLPYYHYRCIFSEICQSINRQDKLFEPPYIGHFY